MSEQDTGKKKHPSEGSLALLAGNETTPLFRYFLNRHVRNCSECLDKVAEFVMLRQEVAALDFESADWDRLAADMRANIHLGLEAGECVRGHWPEPILGRRLAIAFAGVVILLGAQVMLRRPVHSALPVRAGYSVLESTRSGLELRTGSGSLTLLNHPVSGPGDAAIQSVSAQSASAQGVIRASDVDEAGAVTIKSVYLE